MKPPAAVRPSVVSGLFYPDDPRVLREEVEAMISGAEKKNIPGTILGVVSPHAGYVYSGPTAAEAYAQLTGRTYDTVVVIAPSHREFFEGVSVFPGAAYDTPLGEVAINHALRRRLVETSDIVCESESGHRNEHAIEVQLPFLQVVLGKFSLLPLVIGHQTQEACYALADALAPAVSGANILIVASTDLSHYHPAQVARQLDQVVVNDVQRFDAANLMMHLNDKAAEACGGGPTVAAMLALQKLGADHMDVLSFCNSGDITGDSQTVVGYLSAVAWSSSVQPA